MMIQITVLKTKDLTDGTEAISKHLDIIPYIIELHNLFFLLSSVDKLSRDQVAAKVLTL